MNRTVHPLRAVPPVSTVSDVAFDLLAESMTPTYLDRENARARKMSRQVGYCRAHRQPIYEIPGVCGLCEWDAS